MIPRFISTPFSWILILIAKVTTWIRRLRNPDLIVLLEGPYEVDRSLELGSGTYGIVWVGRNVQTNEKGAVKKVKVNDVTKTFVERELEFLTKCRHHPNIIKLLHSEENNDSRYFVLEYCIHGNLNKFIKDRELSKGLCVTFMLDMSQAVGYLHSLRISHRDIKPANILVTDGYILKLADLGLARYFPVTSSGITASHAGTQGWIAPEIYDDSTLTCKYNRSADVFSLGLVFLALVQHQLGRYLRPFTVKGHHLGPWMRFHSNEGREVQVPPIGDEDDKRLELIHSMLAFNPDQRSKMSHVCKKLQELPRDEERVIRDETATPAAAQPSSAACAQTPANPSGLVHALSLLVLLVAILAGGYHILNQGRNVPCEDIWSKLDIDSLEKTLEKNLYGQHLAVEAIVHSFQEHTKHHRPERALMLSLHGSQGVGKSYVSRLIANHLYREGYDSTFVHVVKADIDSVRIPTTQNLKSEEIINWILRNVSVCPCSLFIFDKAEYLPQNLLTDMKLFLASDFRQSIFLFESFHGAYEIGNKTLEHYKAGGQREDITLKSISEFMNTTNETDRMWSAWRSNFVPENMVSAYVPFLLLERKHLLRCIENVIDFDDEFLQAQYGHTKASFVKQVADQKYKFLRIESTSFPLFGCRNAHENAITLLH